MGIGWVEWVIGRLGLERVRASVRADMTEGAGGWVGGRLGQTGLGSNDRELAEAQRQYGDALEAWRKNPYAKRIVDIISDYIIGDGVRPMGTGEIGRFVERFWEHPQNQFELRLPELIDELSRAGDLFLVLFRNEQDGMSYVRPVPKSEIVRIETAEGDWEREVAYWQRVNSVASGEWRVTSREWGAGEQNGGGESVIASPQSEIRWVSPWHPGAAEAGAVMVHYAINRPVGALLGESELATILPWLQRYSRMLEDRVRLNWAARAFLWFVTVPTNRVREKAEQYAAPPEPGSIVIKDDAEQWDMRTPNLNGYDAQHDLRALRKMISAGSGQPPHWHGDGAELNLAVSRAMQDPAVRHLRRRQRQMRGMVLDLCYLAYCRAHEIGRARATPNRKGIAAELPDISREDNESLSLAAQRLTEAFGELGRLLPGYSPSLAERAVSLAFKFAGEPLESEMAKLIVREAGDGYADER